MSYNWKTAGQEFIYKLLNPVINLLVKIGIKPNSITLFGLFINIIACCVFIYGAEKTERAHHIYIGVGSGIILFGGLMDMIDGRLARVAKMESKYGALFDSVLDRYSEMFMFLGICYYLVRQHYFLSSLFAFIAMIGSIMVSYNRARSEGLGVKMADVGLMQRPERILLIGISGILCGLTSNALGGDYKITVDWLPFPLFETITVFTFPIFILAILSNFTAISRLLFAKKALNNNNQ